MSLPSSSIRSGRRRVFAADRPRHAGDDAAVDGVLPQVDELQADLLSQCRHELRLGEDALVDQDASERFAPLLVLPKGSKELVLSDQTVLQQDVAQLLHVVRPPPTGFPAGGVPAAPLSCTRSASGRPALSAQGSQSSTSDTDQSAGHGSKGAHSRVVSRQLVAGAVGEAEMDATPDAEADSGSASRRDRAGGRRRRETTATRPAERR